MEYSVSTGRPVPSYMIAENLEEKTFESKSLLFSPCCPVALIDTMYFHSAACCIPVSE